MSLRSGVHRLTSMLGIAMLSSVVAIADSQDNSVPVHNRMKKDSAISQRGHKTKKIQQNRKRNKIARWSRVHT